MSWHRERERGKQGDRKRDRMVKQKKWRRKDPESKEGKGGKFY